MQVNERRRGVESACVTRKPKKPKKTRAAHVGTMADKIWKTAPNKALKIIKPIVHVGFVPLILYIAMKQEQDLTLWQILFPLASPGEPAPM